jgi:hypothetical protein
MQNLNNTVTKADRTIYLLKDKQIERIVLLSHWEYLEKVKSDISWLSHLTLALHIFQGEVKGFHNVSDLKQSREIDLLPSLKKLLVQILHK